VFIFQLAGRKIFSLHVQKCSSDPEVLACDFDITYPVLNLLCCLCCRDTLPIILHIPCTLFRST